MAVRDYSTKFKKIKGERDSEKQERWDKYSTVLRKTQLETTVNFDTFQSDLSSMGKTIEDIYGGWQSANTMKSTRTKVQDMYKRMNAYQEYQKLYGGPDLSEVAGGYKSILDGWDDLSESYAGYKDAEDYKANNVGNILALKKYASGDTKIEGLKEDKFIEDTSFIPAPEKSWWDETTDKVGDFFEDVFADSNAARTKGIKSNRGSYTDDQLADMAIKALQKTDNADTQDYAIVKGAYERLSQSTKYADSDLVAALSEAKKSWGASPLKSAWKNIKAAGIGIGANLASFANSMGADNIPIVGDVINDVIDANKKAQSEATRYNKGIYGQRVGEFTQGVINLIPYALLGGGPGAAKTALNASKYAKYIKPIAENPSFWYSLTSMWGGKYQEALDGGASEEDALKNAVMYALPAALVEVGGGIGAPGSQTQKLSSTILEEIGEEIAQDILSGAADKATTNPKLPIYSSTEDAVINPFDLAETAMMTAPIVAVGGGVNKVMGKTADWIGEKIETQQAVNAFRKELNNSIKVVGEYKNAVDENLVNFVQEARNNTTDNKSVFKLNKVNDRMAGDISELTGIDVKDYGNVIKANSIRHIIKDHGANGETDSSMADDADIARIQYVIDNYDTMELLEDKSKEYRDKNQKPTPMVKISKRVNGTYYVVEAVPDTNKHELAVVTAYKKKATEQQTRDANSPHSDVRNASAGVAFSNNISQDTDDVKKIENTKELSHLLKGMPKENAKLAKAIYDGKTEVGEFIDSFNLVSEYVDKKVDVDYILKNKGVLTPGQVETITKTLTIEKAQARQKAIDALAEKQGKSMFVKGTVDDSLIDYTNSTKDGSKVNWKNLTSRQRNAVNFVKMFSQATGVNVRLIQSEVVDGKHVGKNGSYDPDTNTIEIDVYAGIDAGSITETIIPTLSHEVTHWMERKAPELYHALSEKVMASLSEKSGKSRNELIDERISKMKKNHPDMEITPEMAVNELVARACEDMLADSKKMRELLEGMSVKERQTFAEKVKTTLKNLMKWINNLLKQYSSTSEEAKYLRDYKEALEEISKLWDETFASAVNANQVLQKAGVKETEITGESKVENSEREDNDSHTANETDAEIWDKRLYEQLNDWLNGNGKKNGKYNGEYFQISTTPNIFKKHGAPDADIIMYPDCVEKITGLKNDRGHIFSIEEIAKIPSQLTDPVLLFKGSVPNSFVALTEIRDKQGNDAIIAIHINKKHGRSVINKIASVYSKTNDYGENKIVSYVNNQILNGNLVDASNKKATNWFTSRGLQLPKLVQTILDANNSISDFEKKVNSNSKNLQFSDRETETVHDLMGENERIKKENKKLRTDFDRLVERLKLERQVTKGDRFDRRKLELIAGHLRKLAKSTVSNKKLIPMLEETFGYTARMDDPDAYNGVQLRLNEIAEAIMADAKPETISDAYAKLILRNIRGSRISLSETQIQEAKNRFGDKWRNSFLGKIIIAKDGTSLDSKWQEWASQYPDYFSADVTEGEQITALFELYDDLKDISEIAVEYDMAEQTRWLRQEILNQFWNTKPIETIADKYEKRIKELNFEHRKMMKEVRDDYTERMEKQKLELRWHTAKMLHEFRAKKDSEIAEAKRLGRERLAKYRENAARKTEIQKITTDALMMNKWLTKNSKDAHINEFLKGIVAKYIQAIDFSSKQLLGMEGTVKDNRGTPTQKDISLSKALREVQNMMSSETINREGLYDLYGHDLGEDIENLVNRVDDVMREVGDNAFVLNQMSLEELKSLQRIGSTIKYAVSKMNDFHAVHHAKGIANLSQESMQYLNSLGEAKVYDDIRGTVNSVVKWDNILPYYAFKRYGAGGEKIFEAFQDGQDKLAFNVRDVIAFTEATYTDEDVKKWSEEIKIFKVPVPATETEMSREGYEPKYRNVQMTIAQVMSLYCLQKRQQAKGHMLGGGLRIANIKIDGKKDIVQTKGITLTEKGLSDIIGSLTDRQRAVADKLQEFMNTVCADWGNEISMKRFGYKAFTEENYFPIQSDANVLQGDVTENKGSDLFRLLNMSFTKSTVIGANNRIVVGNIFDVFAQHSSDMAEYNALALPVLDANKWFNYKEDAPEGEKSFETSSVKEAIEGAFGIDGQSYFTTFLKDINGAKADESKAAKLAGSFFKNAKVAAVGANLRVVLLQPTSYLRANAIIDGQYLTRALAHKPKSDMAKQYCGMALWKSLGYYDTNIQRGVEEQIKHNKNWKDKVTDASLWGAGKADELTWGYLWNACELEVRDTRKDLKVGSEEFYQAIGKRLREIIYATQVVDSTMTRSQTMRRRGMYDKMITAFGSEPTLAYNMVMDAYMSYSLDKKSIGKEAAKKKHLGRIGKVMWAYTATNAVAALVEFAFDALRDDDDEKEAKDFLLMYFKNFGMDMELTSKIPYIKEIWSLVQGFDSSRTDTQGVSYLVKACRNIILSKGKPATTLKYATSGLSYLSGLPFYNAFRDILATMHKFDLLTAEDFNEMFDIEEDD